MDIGSRLPPGMLSGLSLSSMGTAGKQGQPDDLESAAKAFESLFVNELMKSMRLANEAILGDTDTPLMSDDVKFFQSMFDNQIAEHLSTQGGLGIAEALIRQLQNTENLSPSFYQRWPQEDKS